MSASEPTPPGSGQPRTGARQPSILLNLLSLVGATLVVGGITALVFFVVLDLFPGESHAYPAANLVPAVGVLLLGILLIGVGMLREARRRRRGRGASLTRTLSVDLGRMRGALGLGVLLGAVVLTVAMLGAGAGLTRLYEFTESNQFCGETCHSVMEPEWVAFQNSPHARLDCVQCHIGSNPDSYLLYKWGGLQQLLAVATGDYERPIGTPIHNLRPAREICEACHWPERFIGYREMTHAYFASDAESTPHYVRMLTNVGGGDGETHAGFGIHYHMVVASRVDYVARDPGRREIPWVRVSYPDGRTIEFEDTASPLTQEERSALPLHEMDCLDCHNRPAHRFNSPVKSVNAALASGGISRELPFAKAQAVNALAADYPTQAAALDGIAEQLTVFYRKNHPEILDSHPTELARAIESLGRIYRRNLFPEMKARWSAHPDNAGHWNSDGCFRCHREGMRSKEGAPIATACDGCHVILAQGPDVSRIDTDAVRGEPFIHPGDGEAVEEWMSCSDCHDGGAGLY